MDKIFYNQASSEKLGWLPEWFGVQENDEDLVKAAKKWQRSMGLKADGLVGPTTYRRIWTERESKISHYKQDFVCAPKSNNQLVHNSQFYDIKWDKVVLWDEPGGLDCNKGTYSSYAGKPDRRPNFFVTHWDAALSAASCARIGKKRGLSVHFCIDNDGTIYQLLDTQHAAWQAGSRLWNHNSIGVEISNAWYPKYQDWYVKNGFGERPLVEPLRCHGAKLKTSLGFYEVQLDALAALYEAVHRQLGIPLETPLDSDSRSVMGVYKPATKAKFDGFIHHYQLTRNKIDCAGLDLSEICKKAETLKNS